MRTAVVAFLALGVSIAAAQPVAKKQVLCTTFPIYQFARNVAGGSDGVQVGLMLPSGMGCPHDYVLTPQDMNRIATADALVVNGLGLETFLGDSITRMNPKVTVIDSSAGIGGLLALGPGVNNPHLFASPREAAVIVKNIADGLSKIDPPRAALYRQNGQAYAAKLGKLGDEFAAAGKGLRNRKIVTEHAVFDYLARDAGLQIVAVVEEEPGQEPSASAMLRIVGEVKQRGVGAVFAEPQYSARVVQTIAKEAGVPSAALDPVATGPDGAALDYYETTMRANLETLKKTLGYEPQR